MHQQRLALCVVPTQGAIGLAVALALPVCGHGPAEVVHLLAAGSCTLSACAHNRTWDGARPVLTGDSPAHYLHVASAPSS
jgi:hypothetical protein